ncbi:hypothetical protein [Pseudomonas sp. NFX15]
MTSTQTQRMLSPQTEGFARAELFAQTGDQLKRVATGDAILVPVE